MQGTRMYDAHQEDDEPRFRRYVFVYGTLRSGGRLHYTMEETGATFVGDASVAGALYNLGPYPGMTEPRETGDRVRGEGWRVSDEGLYTMDFMEGVEHGLYERVKLTAIDEMANSWDVGAYRYLHPVQEGARITSGDWGELTT